VDHQKTIPAVGVTLSVSGGSPQPAAIVTDTTGAATSQLVVPFGTAVTVTVVGGGTFASSVVGTPAVTLVLDSPVPNGNTLSMDAHAFTDATKLIPAAGVSLTFSGPSGVTISPSTATTDASGKATTHLFNVSNGNSFVVSGGGGLAATTFSE
jgi:hypothetical protein